MQAPESGMKKAGTILLLVGAIVSLVGVLFLVAILGLLRILTGNEGTDEMFLGIGLVYGILALLMVASSILGFLAYGKARRGDLHGAWILGLVSSLLPPVQAITLIGAILCMVCPEHDAQQRGHAAI